MGWAIFGGVICVLVGSLLFFKPDIWYKITESWKSYSDSDPSDLYIKVTKFGGIVFMVMGIAFIILPLILT